MLFICVVLLLLLHVILAVTCFYYHFYNSYAYSHATHSSKKIHYECSTCMYRFSRLLIYLTQSLSFPICLGTLSFIQRLPFVVSVN